MRLQTPVVAPTNYKRIQQMIDDAVKFATEGQSGNYGPLWNATLENGLVKQAANYKGSEAHQTLRWNGTTWVYSSFLQNTGSQVFIGDPASPDAEAILQVYGVSSDADVGDEILLLKNLNNVPLGVTFQNTNSSVIALCGANAGNYSLNTNAGDFIMRGAYGKQVLIGPHGNGANANTTLKVDATGIGVGLGTATVAAMIHAICGSASTVGLVVKGATSQSANLASLQESGGNTILGLTAGGALTLTGGGSNSLLTLRRDGFTSNAAVVSRIAFADFSSATNYGVGDIYCIATEGHSASLFGSRFRFDLGVPGGTTVSAAFFIEGTGDITGPRSAAATNATFGWMHKRTTAGIPTGTPASTYTGNRASVYNSTDEMDMIHYSGGTWLKTGGPGGKIESITGTATISASTTTAKVTMSASSYTVTMPAIATFPLDYEFSIVLVSANTKTLTVQRDGTSTINNGGTSVTATVDGTRLFCKKITATEWSIVRAVP